MTSGRPPEMGVAFFYLYVILFNLGGFMKFWDTFFGVLMAVVTLGFIGGISGTRWNDDQRRGSHCHPEPHPGSISHPVQPARWPRLSRRRSPAPRLGITKPLSVCKVRACSAESSQLPSRAKVLQLLEARYGRMKQARRCAALGVAPQLDGSPPAQGTSLRAPKH